MYWYYPYPNEDYFQANIQQQRPPTQPRDERRFSEEFLQKNIGALVTVYLTYENNPRWNAKILTGTIRDVGRDYFVIRDSQSEKDHLLLNLNLDYMVFEEPARLREDA